MRGSKTFAFENMTLLDPRTFGDPRIARVDHARKLAIGQQVRRQIAVDGRD
jgi:hypothetical protein